MKEIKVNPTGIPFHPLFAAPGAPWTKRDEPLDDRNERVALVSFSNKLLSEPAKKTKKELDDYKRDKEQLTRLYNSQRWLSIGFLEKVYSGLELRALAKALDGFINISKLSEGIRQNPMFEDALSLLSFTELIELERQLVRRKEYGNNASSHFIPTKAKVTDKGKEYIIRHT